jgi:hypothetical protein
VAGVLVVSQPTFLPWIGLFEQIRLADVFIHYDDVQLPQGRSFISRVQIKTSNGVSWLTAPIDHARSGKLISDVILVSHEDWRATHLKTLRHTYARTPHFDLMFELAERIFGFVTDHLSEFNINAIEKMSQWLGLSPKFLRSSSTGVEGSSTERLLGLCRYAGCDTYVTGHGALEYLDHQLLEDAGITTRYMDYRKIEYPQQHGEFTPYVSILDAIANYGERSRELLCSEAVVWKDFLKRVKG